MSTSHHTATLLAASAIAVGLGIAAAAPAAAGPGDADFRDPPSPITPTDSFGPPGSSKSNAARERLWQRLPDEFPGQVLNRTADQLQRQVNQLEAQIDDERGNAISIEKKRAMRDNVLDLLRRLKELNPSSFP